MGWSRNAAMAVLVAVVAAVPGGLAGRIAAQDRAATIHPAGLPRIAKVDERFQSYNVEMAEIIGGNFWKPYGPGGKVVAPSSAPGGGGVAGMDPNLFQALPPLNTANPRLRMLAAALGPAYVRVSGTWANSVYFDDADTPAPAKAPEGFNGVLTRKQWKGVIDFAHAANAEIVSSFSISPGVHDQKGVWTSAQAAAWLAYTRSVGGRIAAAEFFNEPNLTAFGGAPKGYNAADYARDYAVFHRFIKQAAPDMKIAGPGSVGEATVMAGGLPGMVHTEDILRAEPRPVFDIFSYHHYPATSIRCAAMGAQNQTTPETALSEEWLARADKNNAYYAALRDRYEPGKPLWITEMADAACGGNPWAPTFLDTFRYLDSLGRLARQNVAAVFHNTLSASEYGLLTPGSFTPRPNYWAALLWHRWMGTTVLDAGPSREGLHLYAHCLKGVPGGIALLAINNSRTAASSLILQGASERYTLSAETLQSGDVELNGKLLRLDAGDALPTMAGVPERAGAVRFAPVTITFLAVPSAANPSCGAQ